MKLFGFWRSLATYRVRIALSLKRIDYEGAVVNLLAGEQFQDDFRAVNPQAVVPAMVTGEHVLTQSMAILEYLEEIHPEPPLLPSAPLDRARARQIAMICVADSHPLVVPRVRKYLAETLGHDESEVLAWIRNWLGLANAAIEALLAGSDETGIYCQGDAVTLADVCLVPQMQGTLLFEMDPSPYPTMKRIFDACQTLEGFERAHPKHQPDFAG